MPAAVGVGISPGDTQLATVIVDGIFDAGLETTLSQQPVWSSVVPNILGDFVRPDSQLEFSGNGKDSKLGWDSLAVYTESHWAVADCFQRQRFYQRSAGVTCPDSLVSLSIRLQV